MPARRSFRMDKLIVSGLPLFWRREGAKNALVPLSGVLLRRHIPRECLAAFGQRNLRTRLPKSLRLATWSGIVFIDSQCPVGRVQLAVAYLLVCRVGSFDLRKTPHVLVLGAGILLMSLNCAHYFGKFHGGM